MIRYLRNPDLNTRQDIGADGSVAVNYDTRYEGGVFIAQGVLTNQRQQRRARREDANLAAIFRNRVVKGAIHRGPFGR